MSLRLHVVFHGSGPAFIRNPGCQCVRCLLPMPTPDAAPQEYADLLAWVHQANTSASLIIEDDGVAIDHTLVDCGLGVVRNLASLPTPAQGQPINRILLTHGHLDHVIGLDNLLYSLRTGRKSGDFDPAKQPFPLPVYTTLKSWRHGVGYDSESPITSGFLRHVETLMEHIDITDAALSLAAIELHPALIATPIPTEHAPGSVNYLFEFWPDGQGEGRPIRIALCWDLMAYPAERESDLWQGMNLDPFTGPLYDLMGDLDLLAIEMTTWRPHRTKHIGFTGGMSKDGIDTGYGVRALLEAWQPRQTRIVHYSGNEDRHQPDDTWTIGDALTTNVDPALGPVSDAMLRTALHDHLPVDFAIDIAYPGEILVCE